MYCSSTAHDAVVRSRPSPKGQSAACALVERGPTVHPPALVDAGRKKNATHEPITTNTSGALVQLGSRLPSSFLLQAECCPLLLLRPPPSFLLVRPLHFPVGAGATLLNTVHFRLLILSLAPRIFPPLHQATWSADQRAVLLSTVRTTSPSPLTTRQADWTAYKFYHRPATDTRPPVTNHHTRRPPCRPSSSMPCRLWPLQALPKVCLLCYGGSPLPEATANVLIQPHAASPQPPPSRTPAMLPLSPRARPSLAPSPFPPAPPTTLRSLVSSTSLAT